MPKQTWGTLLNDATIRLRTTSSTPELDSEVLLAFALGRNRTWLLAHRNDPIPQTPKIVADQKETISECIEKFFALVDRRTTHEPVAYIVGAKEFYGRDFFVTRDTLVPRPETENMIDQVLAWVQKHPTQAPFTIADIGTGSGCIITTLALALGRTHHYIATDISTAALAVAKKNARCVDMEKNIAFLEGNLLDPITGPVDIIVANLPYVDRATWHEQPDVLHEPTNAVFAKDQGLAEIKKMLRQAEKKLRPTGAIFLECTKAQTKILHHLFPNLPLHFTSV